VWLEDLTTTKAEPGILDVSVTLQEGDMANNGSKRRVSTSSLFSLRELVGICSGNKLLHLPAGHGTHGPSLRNLHSGSNLPP
jgi:hypothetical protein